MRIRNDTLTIIQDEDPWLRIQDDIFYTLKNTGGEAIFYWVDDSVSSQVNIDSELRMRKAGIKFRSIIAEGDTYCLYPLREYRWWPREYFHNQPKVIYADKVALLINEPNQSFILKNASAANMERMQFDVLWQQLPAPSHTTAPQTYE